MTKISIIIRAYNEEQHIGRLLQGISCQKLPEEYSLETILVDSGSTDATVGIATKMGVTVVKINKEDFSFGRALNLGCSQANGDILVFVSAHVYPVYEDWLSQMLIPFHDSKVALVYGRQVGATDSKFSEKQVFYQWFPVTSDFDQKHPFCNNANCAIRKEFWKEQPYDESLTGLEDLDWAKKIKDKGYKIAYNSDAPIVHIHNETPKKIKNRYLREAIAMKHIFPQVHFNIFDFISHFFHSSTRDSIEAIKQGVFFSQLKEIVIFRYMQYLGTYLGHNAKGQITSDLKSRFYYPRKADQKELINKESKMPIDYSK